MDTETPVRFGVIADPQYADAESAGSRDYRASLGKLKGAVATLNASDLDFVVTLGDLIDRDWASFDAALEPYAALRPPHYFVLGNHDFAVAPEKLAEVPGRLGLTARYYDFAVGPYRFVVLDQTEVSLFATAEDSPARRAAEATLRRLERAQSPNARPWNGAMSETQLKWLDARLAAAQGAGERVVVFGHYPVLPVNSHALWDAEVLTEKLSACPQVCLYMAGHHHVGGYTEHEGTHFVTAEGMVETTDDTAFLIVELGAETIRIEGAGRATSRVLKLA